MLEALFLKFDQLFSELEEKLAQAWDCQVIKSGRTTIMLQDGNITISGEFRELRINGKLVRFPEKP